MFINQSISQKDMKRITSWFPLISLQWNVVHIKEVSFCFVEQRWIWKLVQDKKKVSMRTESLHIVFATPETCILAFTRGSLPNVLCGATLGVTVGFTMSSPWQHTEKSSCLPFHRYPGGVKINRLRIQCPGSNPSSWPWPLPPQTVPVVIKGLPSALEEPQFHLHFIPLYIAVQFWGTTFTLDFLSFFFFLLLPFESKYCSIHSCIYVAVIYPAYIAEYGFMQFYNFQKKQ